MALRSRTSSRTDHQGLYPNALLDFHTQDGQLKYDWHLSDPQALADIRWRYNGASSIEVHPEGHLIVHTSVGHFMKATLFRGAGKWRTDRFRSWYEVSNGQISFGVESIVTRSTVW